MAPMTAVEARTSLDTKNWAVARRPSTMPHRTARPRWRTASSWRTRNISGGMTMKVRFRWPALWAIS